MDDERHCIIDRSNLVAFDEALPISGEGLQNSLMKRHGEGNVTNAPLLQELQSDAFRMSTMREGCPQQTIRQLRASDLALGNL